MRVSPLMLPAAAVLAAVGWLGYKVLARPAASLGMAEVAPATRAATTAPHRRSAHRRLERPGEPAAAARDLGSAKSTSAPGAGRPVLALPAVPETLPNGDPRPLNVVHATPEELAVYKLLTPLIERHKAQQASLNFVTCEAATAAPAGEEEPGPLEAPPRDPKQPICLARMQSRTPEDLREILRDASATYKGHLAVEVRLHREAYTGVWYEADVRVDTDEPYQVPELADLSQL